MMDKKKAVDLLDNLIDMVEDNHGADYDTALRMGIEALSANGDIIYRQAALDMEFSNGISVDGVLYVPYREVKMNLEELPSAQPEEVIPHRNYKYLSDYWCACGWHLGKKGEVKYCADCGRKVNWGG